MINFNHYSIKLIVLKSIKIFNIINKKNKIYLLFNDLIFLIKYSIVFIIYFKILIFN